MTDRSADHHDRPRRARSPAAAAPPPPPPPAARSADLLGPGTGYGTPGAAAAPPPRPGPLPELDRAPKPGPDWSGWRAAGKLLADARDTGSVPAIGADPPAGQDAGGSRGPRTGRVPTVAPGMAARSAAPAGPAGRGADAGGGRGGGRWAPAAPGAAAPGALAGAADALRAGGAAQAGRLTGAAAAGAAPETAARRGGGGRLPFRRRSPRPGAGSGRSPGGGDGDDGDDGGGDGSAGTTGRFDRRRVLLAGAAATGLAGVGLYTTDKVLGDRPASSTRPAAERPDDGGAFADRNDSFARTAAPVPPSEPQPTNLYGSASEAAEATQVSVTTILATDDPVRHLLRRTTFGATPALVAEVHEVGIDAWLAQQLDPASIDDAVADGVWAELPLASMSPGDIQRSIEQYAWDAMFQYGQGTIGRQVWSKRQLYEVMVDFWSDHLHVAVPGGAAWDVGNSYYDDVIREHALGSFEEMLRAALQHPAMLRYLSNTQSDKDAVNENLGRELLELHTVGVGSGYTEDDVRNSAYILTGRTEISQYDAEQGRGQAGTFVYDPGKHWTGAVKVLDFQHPNGSEAEGFDVGEAYISYLATHPATARTIARKLVVRFVADDPPDSLVERLATTFTDEGTRIKPVLDVLFRSAELWAAVGQKTKRPLENLVSTLRMVDIPPGPDPATALERLSWWTHTMGHRPLAWPAPDGYADVHAAWRSAGGLLHTWRLHLGVMQGWIDALPDVESDKLIGDRPQATVGEYVDGLCERLCLQTFQAPHRDALLAFVGADAATPAGDVQLHLDHLAGLVLDSAYFALR